MRIKNLSTEDRFPTGTGPFRARHPSFYPGRGQRPHLGQTTPQAYGYKAREGGRGGGRPEGERSRDPDVDAGPGAEVIERDRGPALRGGRHEWCCGSGWAGPGSTWQGGW